MEIRITECIKSFNRRKTTGEKMTVENLGKLLFPTSKQPSFYPSRWGNGYELRRLKIEQLQMMCKILDCTPNELLGY